MFASYNMQNVFKKYTDQFINIKSHCSPSSVRFSIDIAPSWSRDERLGACPPTREGAIGAAFRLLWMLSFCCVAQGL